MLDASRTSKDGVVVEGGGGEAGANLEGPGRADEFRKCLRVELRGPGAVDKDVVREEKLGWLAEKTEAHEGEEEAVSHGRDEVGEGNVED